MKSDSEREIGPRFAQAPYDIEIVRAVVPAVHRRKDAVGTRLDR